MLVQQRRQCGPKDLVTAVQDGEAQAEAPAAPDAPTRPPRFDALSRTSGADAIGQHLYPLLCVSMYEHAWLGDYGFWGKERYMTHFWDCVNWERVERLWGDDRT